jgi:glycerophosphoryl diester phosphodiesterase
VVELKEAGYEQVVLDLITKENLRERVIVVSFLEEALARVRDLDATIETGLIYTKPKKPIETALKLNAQYLVALYRFTHRRCSA